MRANLKPNEKCILVIGQHWFALFWPFMYFFITLLLTIVSFVKYQNAKELDFIITVLVALIISTGWFIYKIWQRKTNLWIVTNLRVIDEYGVFSRNSIDSPLDKIHNVSYHQSLIGRLFGYGNVMIQTAAESGATEHKLINNPKKLRDTISQSQEELKNNLVKNQTELMTSAAGTGSSAADEISKLFDLKENGVITEEEFINQKKKILAK